MGSTSQTLSSERLHPRQASSHPPVIPLSIIDSSVVNFACAAGLWMYTSSPDIDLLRESLIKTLERGYSQWCGQLRFAPYSEHTSVQYHTHRYGRVILELGKDDTKNPGIAFVVVQSSSTLDKHSSGPKELGMKVWDAGYAASSSGLLPNDPLLALHNLVDYKGLPAVVVQVTQFACGGMVIGVKMAHCLGDAQTLVTFVKDWANISRSASPLPDPPLFAPGKIDDCASGLIDAHPPNAELIDKARKLPISRNDWWAPPSSGQVPEWGATLSSIPKTLQHANLEPGTPMAWDELDFTVPVNHYCIHFTADDIDRIWDASTLSAQGVRISKFDALQAFLWTLILRARKSHFVESGDRSAILSVTLGARERTDPPLPSRFLGSPILMARVETDLDPDGSSVSDIGALAAAIRRTVTLFDTEAIGALLHDMAHEICSYRIWGAFLGRRNTIGTSWLRLGAYDVDFGTGAPIVVDAVMPSMDGCIQVMDAAPSNPRKDGMRWYEDGIVASLHLREDVMKNLLQDSLLVVGILQGGDLIHAL